MKQKEHEPEVLKTWLLAGANQLNSMTVGKWASVLFFYNVRTLDYLNSELRKLKGILKPSKKEFGNVLQCCNFSSKNNLASNSLVQREFDSL